MPRSKKEEVGAEPKKRSRTGCWPCKARKVKCGEERPRCANCAKSGEPCDYSIRLNWGGRARRDKDGTPADPDGLTFVATPTSVSSARPSGHSHEHVFSLQHIATAPPARLPPTPGPTPDGEASPGTPDVAFGGLPLDRAAPRRGPQDERFHATSAFVDPGLSPRHSAKRVKLSPHASPPRAQARASFAVPQYPAHVELPSPGSTYFTPYSIGSIGSIVHTPATPGSSVNAGSPHPPSAASLPAQDTADLRRLSVKSLLSDPAEDSGLSRHPGVGGHGGYRTHGYDHGLPDLDVPRNDDHAAIRPRSPDLRRASAAASEGSASSGDNDPKEMAFEPGGYYARPVPIKVSRSLEPLPAELLDIPINLLYFHHFINHTGRIMVPHDCAENPLRGVLPQMAVRNRQLLHLVLTFSASHRARLLGHPEPANRIAGWMSDVLPALRSALDGPSSPGVSDPTDLSSLAPLATAIMLASLEIVSPNTFAVPIRWQDHLHVARRLIVAKGGLHHLAQKADGARDRAVFFLSRWFAYLDVLGSLSGGRHDRPLYGAYLEDGGGLWLVNRNDDEVYQIDCFFGFSGRCIALLAAVAALAAESDGRRIDPATGRQRPGWQPPDAVREQAQELKRRLNASAQCVYRGCMHFDPDIPDGPDARSRSDIDEISATNEAFHWSGLIHLSRRVLGLPRDHPEVQDGVSRVLASLAKVRRGSTAESCLLFPMFTAGCEAQDPLQRRLFAERLQNVEGWGMQHVARARALMQKVWDTGDAWEGLVNGEFFG